MLSAHSKESLNAQILAEASEWLVEFEAGDADAEARRNFDAWLRRSPEHVRAYLELLPIWKHGADSRFKHDAGPESLIAYAGTEGNVAPLDVRTVHEQAASRKAHPSHRHFASAAAVAVVALGMVLGWRAMRDGSTYSTAVGEQHSAVLSDGSTLELNALSKVRTHFTARERRVDLLEGQALFRVAKDAARPFIVNIDGTYVRAVGTQFDIYRKASGTTITVLEGRVAVLSSASFPAASAAAVEQASRDESAAVRSTGGREGPTRLKDEGSAGSAPPRGQEGNAGAAPLFLTAGEQVTVDSSLAGLLPKPKRANLAVATAWTQRRLVFEDATLEEVVHEFNRYNRRQLVIHDPALGALEISIGFSTTDPGALIRFLEEQPEIAIEQSGSEVRISKR